MAEPPRTRKTARCACGSVELVAIGDPITSVACYCESCQEGSRQIEALPNGRAVCAPDGGTAYVLYRKDRVEYPKGSRLLRGLKLRASVIDKQDIRDDDQTNGEDGYGYGHDHQDRGRPNSCAHLASDIQQRRDPKEAQR